MDRANGLADVEKNDGPGTGGGFCPWVDTSALSLNSWTIEGQINLFLSSREVRELACDVSLGLTATWSGIWGARWNLEFGEYAVKLLAASNWPCLIFAPGKPANTTLPGSLAPSHF